MNIKQTLTEYKDRSNVNRICNPILLTIPHLLKSDSLSKAYEFYKVRCDMIYAISNFTYHQERADEMKAFTHVVKERSAKL